MVDSHQHFWDPTVFPELRFPPEQRVLQQVYLPDRLRPELDRTGVDYTVLIQALPQTEENNRWLFDLAEKTDFVAGVVAWTDLTKTEGLDSALKKLQEHSLFCGIRHIAEIEDDGWFCQKEVLHCLRELARRKIPYDAVVRPGQLRHVLRIAREVPTLPVVIDHLGKPDIAGREDDDWAGLISEIARFPQVSCKISGLVTQADWKNWKVADLRPFVRHVLEVFGPDRLMFGSDWPVCCLAGGYQRVWESANETLSDLSEPDRRKVFGENAVRFYGLQKAMEVDG